VSKHKRVTSPQPLLFPLPERTEELAEIRFEQAEHPVWTESKATLVEQYLHLFVLLTKHGTYIDGFAGPQRPDNPEMWSAKLVLENEPQWIRNIFLFDKSKNQIRRLCGLRRAQRPVQGRVIRIFRGDFNSRVHQLLARNRISRKEAMFCLLDQRTFQCDWNTLVELAKYKGPGQTKIELFYFLAVRWLKRALKGVQNEAILCKWWGHNDCEMLRELKPRQIKDKLVERFKSELGYKSVQAWPIFKQHATGQTIYYMIHATDHADGPKLMARAYNAAVISRGKQTLFPWMHPQ